MQIIHAYKAEFYIRILAGGIVLLRKTLALVPESSNIFVYIPKP